MAQVLCFGNLQLDVLCRPVASLPAPGALDRVEQIDVMLSGNAGSQATVLGRLGVSVDIAGYRGADLLGSGIASTLAGLGVGAGRLLPHGTASTGISAIAVAPNGERSVLFVNGANELFNLDEVPDDWLDGPDVVSVASLFTLPQFTGASVGRLLARARGFGATTVLNIGWPPAAGGLGQLRPALAESDYFVSSHLEGGRLTVHKLPDDIIESVEALSKAQVILTLGADGCCYRHQGARVHVPAQAVDATDSTGAGDSFIAGFIAGLLEHFPLADCARLGCIVASYAVAGPGAYPRVPPLAAIKSQMEVDNG